jgi:tRNA pseudouridine38-40 synthase
MNELDNNRISTQQQRNVLLLEYDGAAFSGSQIQQNAYTVQQALEESLAKLNIVHGAIFFSGRTDAEVHARGQVAHFDTSVDALSEIPDLVAALNAVLPRTMAVRETAITEPDGFHSLLSAEWRWYRYRVYNHPVRSVWMRSDAAWVKSSPLDLDEMQRAADMLLGEQDFESFKCPHTEVPNNVCNVIHSQFSQEENGDIVFDIVANRFVYKMVRNLCGTLLKIGQHTEFTPDDIPLILSSKDRRKAGPTAQPRGLSLMAVQYPKPWDFFLNDVCVTRLDQIVQESSRYEKNILRKAS